MNFINKEFFKSKSFAIGIMVVGVVLLGIILFSAGSKFGFDRAMFLCTMNKNYEKNFIGERGGSWNEISGRNAIGMHGIIGQILTAGTSSLTVVDRDGLEKSVFVSTSTTIRSFNKNISISDLKVNTKVIIFGRPNDKGQVIATMIRLAPDNVPSLPDQDDSSTTIK